MTSSNSRIRSARAAICTYERSKGVVSKQDDTETICDLLTDLRHYCADRDVDFELACRHSRLHFLAETGRRRG